MSSPAQTEEFSFPVPRPPTNTSQLRKQVESSYLPQLSSLCLHNFLPCVAHVSILVHMQNPLTSRATVVDCSDRQNGAATPLPKPTPIPKPKLKPDVRPGKVSHHLRRQRWNTTQLQQQVDDQCAVKREQLADTTRKGLQSDGLDASYKITPRSSRQALKSQLSSTNISLWSCMCFGCLLGGLCCHCMIILPCLMQPLRASPEIEPFPWQKSSNTGPRMMLGWYSRER